VTAPLPQGFCISLDAEAKELDESTLFGGSPARIMRLSPAGRKAWAELRSGAVRSRPGATLARRLTDGGIAHPRPPITAKALDVTVVIPVRDRPAMLARCLTALGGDHPIVVVDDGSEDAQAVADVVAEVPCARLIRRADGGGPAAARNTGLSHVETELVAFLDSDCIAPAGWIEQLAAHLADPLVQAVAPRIVPIVGETWVGRYSLCCSSLDMGEREALVVPASRVAYVPTAALVVRRSALLEVASPTDVFDVSLRYGEDVDLIWRLQEKGGRIRYDPSVEVGHAEPPTWVNLLIRRFHYGTSAAPLSLRHPKATVPLILQPWPTVSVVGLLAGHPTIAGLSCAASALSMHRVLRRVGLPFKGALPGVCTAIHRTWLGIGRYTNQFAAPVLLALLVSPGGSSPIRRWGRRAATSSLLLGPSLTTWVTRRPALGPFRFALAQLADDAAYGAGVWFGCARARTLRPVRPVVSWPSLRVTPPEKERTLA
jgi:mycofactocin system glycosyltransferase